MNTTTSTSDPVQQAETLRREMRSIRRELGDNVEELVENAERLMDWRYYWQRYPWGLLGAAALLGYFVVPRRMVSMSVDGHSLDDLVHRLAPAITSRVEKVEKKDSKPGWFGALLSLGVGMLTKAAAGYASQYLTQMLSQPAAHQPSRPEEAHYG